MNEQNLVVKTNQNLTIHTQTVKAQIRMYWEPEEVRAKIQATQNPKYRMLFTTLWMSGLRISEVINLEKQHIDFTNYIMRVKWLKNRKYQERIVPIHPQLRDMIQVYTGAMKFNEKLFDFSRQRAWQVCKEHMGGKPHMFRHSFAVNWLRCDGDLVVLHRILGHSKIQTTMEYLKIVPVDQGKELIKIKF